MSPRARSRARRRALAGWWATTLFVVCLHTATRPQTVSETWKKGNERDNRWEGADLLTPVTSRPLELVSFLTAPRDPTFQAGDELTLSFYLAGSDPVRFYAREVVVDRHYWMEPKPRQWTPKSWNDWGPWPTAEVLSQLKVRPRNVGVLVRLDNAYPGDGRVAPVLVRSATPSTEAPIDQYVAVFLAGTAYIGGKHEVRRGCAAGGEIVHSGPVGQQRSGLGFSVPFELTKRPAGEYLLVVSMMAAATVDTPPPPAGRGTADLTTVNHRYCFYHQPTRAPR